MLAEILHILKKIKKSPIFIFAAEKEEIMVSHYVLENWEYLVQG